MNKMEMRKSILWSICGWLFMIIPVSIYLLCNTHVFTPAKISALLILLFMIVGISSFKKLKDIGGLWCIAFSCAIFIMRGESFIVMGWGLGIFGVCNLISSVVFFKLSKYYKEVAYGHPIN